MRKLTFITLLTTLLLSACSAAATDLPATEESDLPVVTVYRAPT